MELKQAIDILDRFDFFQGQRAGRELWNDKPFDVQEQDIANFSRDISLVKEYINSQEQRIKELTEENAEVKANWQKLKDSYDNNDKEWREAYADSQSKWEKAYEKLELTLEGVMHFVDKWLDGAELEKDEVNRAITMREKTLQIVEKLTEENERLKARVLEENNLRHQVEEMLANGMSAVKTDTVREMCQRIKEYFPYDADSGLYVVLDQIAKEMLEGE